MTAAISMAWHNGCAGTNSSATCGFTVPMRAWLRGPLRPILEETVLAQDAIAGLAVDRAAVRALSERHLSAKADLGWHLWLLLSLALWERCYYRARGRVAS